MAKRKSLEFDMVAGSQLRDTQSETLSVEGADISELEAGRGCANDNHGKARFNCIGRITSAKKIYKAEDCTDPRHTYYWDKIKAPYIYAKGYLFDDEDHPNARAAAAILRNIHKTDSPLKLKASVEGGVISRGIKDPSILAHTKIHSIALTFSPANNATLVEPLNLSKSSSDWEADLTLIKSVLHLAETNVPSFRHIARDASAEKVKDNLSKINTMLVESGKTPINIPSKQEIIHKALEEKIANNIIKINELVKGAAQLAPVEPSLANEVGKTHTVEVHPDLDHLYRAKGLIKENKRDYLHIGDYKKQNFPSDIIKKIPRDANGKVTPEMIDEHIASLPKKKVNVEVQPYTWGSQQHRPGPQYALSVQLHPEEKMKMKPEHKDTWSDIEGKQHRLDTNRDQIGWSRVDAHAKPDHWHVDEIQSDFQNKDKINNKLELKDEQSDLYDYLHQYTGGNGAYWVSIADTKEKDKAEKDPHYKAMAKLHNDVVNDVVEFNNTGADEEVEGPAYKALLDEAKKRGIIRPNDIIQKENDKQKSHTPELLNHLSHGHDDPQHMIHSATNALGRKLGIKSTSMDTPEDQATQSGLKNAPGRVIAYPTDNDRIFNPHEYMHEYHPTYWEDHELPSLKDGSHLALRNPNFKTGLEKIGGIDGLTELANFTAGTGSSVDLLSNADDLNEEPRSNVELAKKIKTLSDPERHALEGMLNNHYGNVQNAVTDDARANDVGDVEGDNEEKPFDISKSPVHQIDTYHKRARKLGMKRVDKNSLFGEHPNDKAKEVQYMNLHKKLKFLLEELNKNKKETSEPLDKGIKQNIVGALTAGALSTAPMGAPQKALPIQLNSQPAKHLLHENVKTPDITKQIKHKPTNQEVHTKVAKQYPLLGAIGNIESGGGLNTNHETIQYGSQKGQTAGGIYGMMPQTASFILSKHPELAKKYPELSLAAKDIAKNHKQFTDTFNSDPQAAADFAVAHFKRSKGKTKNDSQLVYSWLNGLKGSWNKLNESGLNGIKAHPYVQKVMEEYHKLQPQKGKQNKDVMKAMMAGYGGAGMPTSQTGGAVIQSESLEQGRPGFKYVTCDDCGDEQVHAKHQVRCRKCGSSFNLEKLYKLMVENK